MGAIQPKRGAVEFDKLVLIIVALAVLLIVVIFFKSGFGSLAANLGLVSKNTTAHTPSIIGNMSGALNNVSGQWG